MAHQYWIDNSSLREYQSYFGFLKGSWWWIKGKIVLFVYRYKNI